LECGEPVPSRSRAETCFAKPKVYTPKYLADKTLTSKSALEGERKQVTVLFADLKGSMGYSPTVIPKTHASSSTLWSSG